MGVREWSGGVQEKTRLRASTQSPSNDAERALIDSRELVIHLFHSFLTRAQAGGETLASHPYWNMDDYKTHDIGAEAN